MNPPSASTVSAPSASRRRFLGAALAAGAAPFILPSRVWSADTPPNSRVRMAFIGTGKQNAHLMGSFLGKESQVEVVAVCDVDSTRRNHAAKRAREFYKSKGREEKVDACNDFREIIARKDIDAVCVATPDHWHAIITVAALNSGKDVYCEKPLVHTVREAVAVIDAVKRNGRVLQTGSMQRSSKEFRAAAEVVRNGFIGEVKHIVCQFGKPGKPCDLPEQEAEPGLDWDLWLGPAPLRPYHSELSPRGVHDHFPNWRLYTEYGGGYVTDWGAHHLDIAQWALGMDESGPVEVQLPDGAQQAGEGARLVYANGVAVEHRNNGFGVDITGSEGVVRVNRGRLEVIIKGETVAAFTGSEKNTSLDREVAKLDNSLLKDPKVKLYRTPNGDHLGDFITAVKTRQKPCTHEVIGGRTATVCNLMNIAYREGVSFGWDPENMTFKGTGANPAWLDKTRRGDWSLG